MDKKVKYWILCTISQANEKTLEVNRLFEQKPEFFKGDISKLFKCLMELEGEGLIQFDKEYDEPAFKITDKGEADVQEYLKTANVKDVFGSNNNCG